MMLEDKWLLWRFKRGQVDALRQIYDKYKADLLKFAIALTGDVPLAEDVVQDVFVKLAQTRDRVRVHGNLRNYLITCLINRIRSLRRVELRRQAKTPESFERFHGIVQGPDQWAVANEELSLLSKALIQLPMEQREAIALRYEANLGFRQIARLQGVSVNTAQGRYRYGMEKLRLLLNGEVTK